MKISFSRAREKNLNHFSSRISRDRDSCQCLGVAWTWVTFFWDFPTWIFNPFSDLKVFRHWSHLKIFSRSAVSASSSEISWWGSFSRRSKFFPQTLLSFLHFVSQLMGLVSSSSSWLGKTRLPSPWIPRRRRSYSQQTGRRRRIDSCQPASGKSPDTETQETRLQALQPFSQIISELEISSGEPKCTCWQVDRSSEAHGRQVIQFSAILPHA